MISFTPSCSVRLLRILVLGPLLLSMLMLSLSGQMSLLEHAGITEILFALPTNSVVRETTKDSTYNVTKQPATSDLVIDIVSVGSISRLELLDNQQRTIGSHVNVRNFFSVTELDDADPACHTNLTWDQVRQISRFCRQSDVSKFHPVYQYLRHLYAREQWLEKKPNPPGWMCAIPRPYHGLAKAVRHYAESKQDLPDWFIVIDDDTYYNMELFSRNIANHQSSELTVLAGCLVRQPVHIINFTFPFGGFGSILSRASMMKLLHPIQCPSQEDGLICDRLEDNIVGERSYFENGMSLFDLMLAYISRQLYREVDTWTDGFCLHSDWVMGYFVNFYNISSHVKEPYYEAVPQARMETYVTGSEIYRQPQGLCRFEATCQEDAEVCHKMPSDWVNHELERWRQIVPDRFRAIA